MNPAGDGVAVERRGDRRHVGVREQIEDALVRNEIAGEDQAGDGLAIEFAQRAGGKRGEDHIFAIARRDDERPGLEILHDVRRIHRADDDLLHTPPRLRFAVEEVAFDRLADLSQRGVGEQRLLGNRAEQIDAEPREAAPREVADVFELVAAGSCSG